MYSKYMNEKLHAVCVSVSEVYKFSLHPVSLTRWCAVLVLGTDTHWSTSKTGWPKCVTTAMLSSGKEVNLSFLCEEVCQSCGYYRGVFLHFDLVLTLTLSVCVGGSVSGACGNASPRTHRASRPLSAVFQSLQPPNLWKSRKSTSPLNQVEYT